MPEVAHILMIASLQAAMFLSGLPSSQGLGLDDQELC